MKIVFMITVDIVLTLMLLIGLIMMAVGEK